MISVESKVVVHEIDGKDRVVGDDTTLVVRSHHNRDDLVILVFGTTRWAVRERDLVAAIKNSTNSARF
jgi:hypothetical protein